MALSKEENHIERFLCPVENELLAPTLLSVRRKTIGADPDDPTSVDEDEEDPLVANLEQDEAETEAETQRTIELSFRLKFSHRFASETPSAASETMEMSQTNQNVLRLLEDDEKVGAAARS